MTFKIGTTDITSYIAHGGIKWQKTDVDGANAGRTLDGTMHRDYIATKIRLDITCRPLTGTEAATLLALIAPQTVSVTYDDPMSGARTNVAMYSNNYPAAYYGKIDNTDYWTGITFPLIEM